MDYCPNQTFFTNPDPTSLESEIPYVRVKSLSRGQTIALNIDPPEGDPDPIKMINPDPGLL